MDKLKRVLSGNDSPNDENSSIMTNINESTTFSWTTRIQGFAICFVVGILFTLLGSLVLMLNLGMKRFAIFYTLGNIISMSSTCFLMGPFNQLKKMFNQTRIVATLIVIVSLVMTLVSAIVLQKSGLALLFIIIQSLALTWYSLSYIPWARDAVKKTITTCVV